MLIYIWNIIILNNIFIKFNNNESNLMFSIN